MQLPDLGDEGSVAVTIWNEMGGEIHWTAIPLLAAIHGVDDIEALVRWLTSIRDEMRASTRNG